MEIPRIEPHEALRLLESGEGYVYLDVRSVEEFRDGHAPGAVNVPLLRRSPHGPGLVPNVAFLEEVRQRFDRQAKIITGCLRGGRSSKAAMILAGDGYTCVLDLRGGYDAELDREGNVVCPGWARCGLPTERGE